MTVVAVGRAAGVAILTGREGPVPHLYRVFLFGSFRCCDPHRPRRAGATRVIKSRFAGMQPRVAILTGREGPVPRPECGAGDGPSPVAILTGREGPVPPARPSLACHAARMLRSSPAAKGRCHSSHLLRTQRTKLGLRSSPAAKGRCHHVQAGPDTAVGAQVAILTGREGPVPPYLKVEEPKPPETLRSSPAAKGRCHSASRSRSPASRGCDPHRPRRAGATLQRVTLLELQVELPLRSSPAAKGRCHDYDGPRFE